MGRTYVGVRFVMKYFILMIFFTPNFAVAESATAQAIMEVIKPLQIQTLSNLVFPQATPGSSAYTVNPGDSDNENNASFSASGQPDTSYVISHPDTVVMTTGSGSANETITISSIQTNPAKGANGLFDASGTQMIYLGASRPALSPDQVQGDYQGQITVEIVY